VIISVLVLSTSSCTCVGCKEVAASLASAALGGVAATISTHDVPTSSNQTKSILATVEGVAGHGLTYGLAAVLVRASRIAGADESTCCWWRWRSCCSTGARWCWRRGCCTGAPVQPASVHTRQQPRGDSLVQVEPHIVDRHLVTIHILIQRFIVASVRLVFSGTGTGGDGALLDLSSD